MPNTISFNLLNNFIFLPVKVLSSKATFIPKKSHKDHLSKKIVALKILQWKITTCTRG